MVTEVHLPVRRAAVLGAAGLMVAAALTACAGGSGSASTTSAAAATTPTQTARAGRFNQAELQRIRDCLSAAGIDMPTPTRTFNPSERPTARPTARPSGAPTGGGGFGNRGLFADPKVRAALEACGIALPTGRPTGAGGPGGPPAATPTGG